MRFGFVVHPLTVFQQHLLGVPSLDLRLLATGKSRRRPARRLARFTVEDPAGRRAHGLLAAVPWLPDTLLTDQEAGIEAIAEAVALCHADGAEVVGLGAVAAMIGGQGKAVAKLAPCAVSTGNAFTALAAVETIARIRRLDARHHPIGLLGPPGPVANAIHTQLAGRGDAVEVISDSPPRPLVKLVESLNATHHGHIRFVDAPTLGPGHILVAASSTGGRLPLSSLPAGSVVVDVAAPQDVLHDVPRRDDVLILDGEYVRLPRPLIGEGWRRAYGWVTGQGRSVFACFAEPMLMALAEDTSLCSVGRTVPDERLRALGNLASQHGFWVDRLHEYGRPLSTARVRRFLQR